MPQSRIIRMFNALDLEEKILNGASIFALVSVFFPWFSGEWLGEADVTYNGFTFFTSFIGWTIFLLHLAILALTVVPAFGGPSFVKRHARENARLSLAGIAAILSLAAISVLMNVTNDYTRMEIRFGVFCTFAGSIFATLYAFWKTQEQRKREAGETFHHPEDHEKPEERPVVPVQPLSAPPPPPPPLEPEEYRPHR